MRAEGEDGDGDGDRDDGADEDEDGYEDVHVGEDEIMVRIDMRTYSCR